MAVRGVSEIAAAEWLHDVGPRFFSSAEWLKINHVGPPHRKSCTNAAVAISHTRMIMIVIAMGGGPLVDQIRDRVGHFEGRIDLVRFATIFSHLFVAPLRIVIADKLYLHRNASRSLHMPFLKAPVGHFRPCR